MLNGYDVTRCWFDFVNSNKRLIKPIHHAIIHWIFHKANESSWDEEFQVQTKQACENLGVLDRDTYQKAFKDLIDFGAIKVVQEAQGLHVARWVSFKDCKMYLSVFQVSKHVGKRVSKHVGSEVGTTPIIKPIKDSKLDKPKKYNACDAVLPFNSEAFKISWTEWTEYRAQSKKPLSEISVNKQLKLLSEQGELNSIKMIDKAIANSWTGLFELNQSEKVNHNGNTLNQRSQMIKTKIHV